MSIPSSLIPAIQHSDEAEHSYDSRPKPTHPIVMATTPGRWILLAEARDDLAQRKSEAADAARFVLGSEESSLADAAAIMGEDWDRGLRGADLIEAVELGRLCAEADCMNGGFCIHYDSGYIELDLLADDPDLGEHLRGLEAIIERFEAAGCEVEILTIPQYNKRF